MLHFPSDFKVIVSLAEFPSEHRHLCNNPLYLSFLVKRGVFFRHYVIHLGFLIPSPMGLSEMVQSVPLLPVLKFGKRNEKLTRD